MTSLADHQIKISLDPPTENKIIIKENIDWSEAIEVAKLCRQHHPDEPIDIVPKQSPDGLIYDVYRVVK